MRRFRFIGDTIEYPWLTNGNIYDAEFNYQGAQYSVDYLSRRYPEDWQEVFDDPKPLHKYTDLGYFSGLAMQGILANENTARQIQSQLGDVSSDQANKIVCATARNIAKELIRQLDKESPNNLPPNHNE